MMSQQALEKRESLLNDYFNSSTKVRIFIHIPHIFKVKRVKNVPEGQVSIISLFPQILSYSVKKKSISLPLLAAGLE